MSTLSPHAIVQVNQRWTGLLSRIFPALRTRTIDLAYTIKGQTRSNPFSSMSGLTPDRSFTGKVLSIRGDIRDWIAARRIYPEGRLRFTGLDAFLARKLRLFNLPYRTGLIAVQNRYSRWAHHLGVSCSSLVKPATKHLAGSAVIHMGTQWLSKRYPWSGELQRSLTESGIRSQIVLSPQDPGISLPSGIHFSRVADEELLDCFNSADLIITNDSAPMHIGAALGKKVAVLTSMFDIREWIPPGEVLAMERTPQKGYRGRKEFRGDSVVANKSLWLSPEEILGALRSADWIS
jgi:ADP-heptose:LPS heptosyltransferase